MAEVIYFGKLGDMNKDSIILIPNNLFLLSKASKFHIFEFIPKHFTISTKNNSCKFNIELLKDTSQVINDLLKENPDNLHYILNIDDEKNVLEKFEKLYEGCHIKFNEDEILISTKIINLLQIRLFNISSILGYLYKSPDNLQIEKKSFSNFLKNEDLQTFTITTNKKEYKCNSFGVYSSNIICEKLKKDSQIKQFHFNFDDDDEEFQLICDLFNFKHVEITSKNMNSLKIIAERLQIKAIINQVNDFITKYEEKQNKINEQKLLIDSINNLFYWLYNIKKISVERVKDFIVQSDWISKIEKVQDLVAFILQVFKTDSSLHQEIVDLLIKLSEEAKESNNCLNILMPFIIEKLINLFDDDDNNFTLQFIYLLYNRGMFPKEEITKKIEEHSNNDDIQLDDFKSLFIKCFNLNVDLYTIISEDKLAKSIKNDDLNTMKQIITKEKIDINNFLISPNISDDFTEKMNILNYSAMHGSIECFKYLFSNNKKVDKQTLINAIDGGNNEIIKTVYQNMSDKDENKKLIFLYDSDIITKSIIKHRNELFDWIFEECISTHTMNAKSLESIASISASSGNIHSMIKVIENDIIFSFDCYQNIIKNAARNGFYTFIQILNNLPFKIKKEEENNKSKIDIDAIISFGNYAILDSYAKTIDKNHFKKLFLSAIKKNKVDVLNYLFDNFVNKVFTFKKKFYVEAIRKSLSIKGCNCFDIILNQFRTLNPKVEKTFITNNFLYFACEGSNFSAAQLITEYILTKKPKYDFTEDFIKAMELGANEICKYLIEKQVQVDYDKLAAHFPEEASIDYDVFVTIYYNCNQYSKEKCLDYLNNAINCKNIKIIEFVLERKKPDRNSLIKAVLTNDIKIVDLILKYNSSPSFINFIEDNNTALSFAVKEQNLDIVDRLVSIPGINPNLANNSNEYPLILAIEIGNLQIIDSLFNFFGKDFQSNSWITIDVMEKLSNLINNENHYGFVYINICTIDPWDVVKHVFEIEYIDIDPNFGENGSFLYRACIDNKIEMVKFFLKNDKIDVNKYSCELGQTPLIGALIHGNIDIAELLINYPETNINYRDFQRETALTISVQNNLNSIVKLLIKNEKFNPKESRLNHAFIISEGEISKMLISLDFLDINHIFNPKRKTYKLNDDDDIIQTFLTRLVYKKDVEKIDLIINHPSFDREKSNFIDAVFIAVIIDNVSISKKLLNLLDNDLNITNKNNETLSSFAKKHRCRNVLKEFFNS